MMSFPLIQSFFAHWTHFIMFFPMFHIFMGFPHLYQRANSCCKLFCYYYNLDIIASTGQRNLKQESYPDQCLCCAFVRWCFIQNLAWTFVFIRNSIARIKKTLQLSSFCLVYIPELHGLLDVAKRIPDCIGQRDELIILPLIRLFEKDKNKFISQNDICFDLFSILDNSSSSCNLPLQEHTW